MAEALLSVQGLFVLIKASSLLQLNRLDYSYQSLSRPLRSWLLKTLKDQSFSGSNASCQLQ